MDAMAGLWGTFAVARENVLGTPLEDWAAVQKDQMGCRWTPLWDFGETFVVV